jgi:hypothetical protein
MDVKLWIARCVVSICVGVLVTVGSSWACAIHVATHKLGWRHVGPSSNLSVAGVEWRLFVPRGGNQYSRRCATRMTVLASEDRPPSEYVVLERCDTGWPWHSFSYCAILDPPLTSVPPRIGVLQGGIVVSSVPRVILPVWPNLPEMTISVSLFTLLTFTLMSAVSQVRMSWRRTRRKCLYCAYPLAASGICPECGRRCA